MKVNPRTVKTILDFVAAFALAAGDVIVKDFTMKPNTIIFLNIFKKAGKCVIMKTVMRNETFSNNRSGIRSNQSQRG